MFGIVYCLILKRLIQPTMTTLQPTTNLINLMCYGYPQFNIQLSSVIVTTAL